MATVCSKGFIIALSSNKGPNYGYEHKLAEAAADGRGWSKIRYLVNEDESSEMEPVGVEAMEAHLQQCKDVEIAFMKGNHCTVLYIRKKEDDTPGWGHLLKMNLGIEMMSGAKVAKRGLPLLKSSVLYGELPRLLQDVIEFHLITHDEKAHDGAIVLGRGFLRLCIKEMLKKNGTPRSLIRKILKTKAFNGRMWMPGGIVPEYPNGGLVKGQFFFSPNIGEWEIHTHKCNIKEEVRVEAGSALRWILDPQPGKEPSRLNVQYLSHMHKLFSPEYVKKLAHDTFAEIFIKLRDGKTFDEIEELREQWRAWEASSDEDKGNNPLSETSQYRRMACEWSDAGGLLKELPSLLHNLGQLGTTHLADRQNYKLRLKIPNSLHWQLISYSVMKLIDPSFEKPKHLHLKFREDFKVVIANDEDFVSVLMDHGGSDMDDFYDFLFRNSEKYGPMVIAMRLPNDLGEYSVWQIEGLVPKSIDMNNLRAVTADGDWPWPTRKSKMKGLKPSVLGKKKDNAAGVKYSKEDCIKALNMPSAHPGWFVKSTVLNNLVLGQTHNDGMTMEEGVDASVQGGSAEDIELVELIANERFVKTLASNKPVPYGVWNQRGKGKKKSIFEAKTRMLELRAPRQDPAHWMDVTMNGAFQMYDKFREALDALVKKMTVMFVGNISKDRKLRDECKWTIVKWYNAYKGYKSKEEVKQIREDLLMALADKYRGRHDELMPTLFSACQDNPGSREWERNEYPLLQSNKFWTLLCEWRKGV